MRLYIEGQPIAAPRPRVTRAGRAYMPKTYTQYKKSAITQLRCQYKDDPLDKPVYMYVEFIFKRLAKTPKRQKDRVFKIKKPDIDNCLKSTLDSLVDAGVLLDDNIVVSINAVKYIAAIDEPPHVTIYIGDVNEVHESKSQKKEDYEKEEAKHESLR